jgi:hypothetical protein
MFVQPHKVQQETNTNKGQYLDLHIRNIQAPTLNNEKQQEATFMLHTIKLAHRNRTTAVAIA